MSACRSTQSEAPVCGERQSVLVDVGIPAFEGLTVLGHPQLGAFQGRIARDNIVDQAGYLAKGDKAGFEAKYGALGGELQGG